MYIQHMVGRDSPSEYIWKGLKYLMNVCSDVSLELLLLLFGGVDSRLHSSRGFIDRL